MAELQPEAGPHPVVREQHSGRIGLSRLFRPQAGDLGAPVLQQRGNDGLGGLFLFVLPPLAVLPDSEAAGTVLTEKALPALGDGSAAPGTAAHSFAGGGEQHRAALYRASGLHQLPQHGGDLVHEVSGGQGPALHLFQPMLPLGGERGGL